MAASSPNDLVLRLLQDDSSLWKLKLVYPLQDYLNESFSIEDFLSALRSNTTVEYVLVDKQFLAGLEQTTVEAFLSAIGSLTSLFELEIWSGRVPLAALARALRHASNLGRLGLGFVSLYDTTNCNGLYRHNSLRSLYLSDFRFVNQQDANLDSFLGSLASCPNLAHVEIFANRHDVVPWSFTALGSLSSAPSLQSLTLRRLELELTHVAAMEFSTLNVLDFNENALGDDGCLVVTQAIQRANTVKELTLRSNRLTSRGCEPIVNLLLTCNQVERLNLACNDLQDEGACALAVLVRQSNSLKHLELARCGISDVGCTQIAEAVVFNSSLLNLGLSFNHMTDTSYVAFAQALSHNITLKSINLQTNRNNITYRGCDALLEMLKENFTLEHLSTMLSSDSFTTYQTLTGGQIRTWLRLNQGGRRKFLLHEASATRADWIDAIRNVQDDLSAVFYLLNANPLICQSSFPI